MISQHKTREAKQDIGITVQLFSVYQIVSYFARFGGSRELCSFKIRVEY